MDYKSFIKYVQQEVQKQYSNAEVIINKVQKNNGKELDGLVIKEKQESIIPCIYLNPYYSQYQQGDSIESIVNDILQNYQSAKENSNLTTSENIMLQNFSDFDSVKNRIVFKIINQEKNQELLQSVPYTKFLDLAIVYMILVEEKEEVIGTILINNDHSRLWRVDAEVLHSYAINNTPKILPVQINSMEAILRNFINEVDMTAIGKESETALYVMSNYKGINGAATMLYPDVLKDFRNTVCQNAEQIYILPSSVNECLLHPYVNSIRVEQLEEMVRDVNCTQVMAEEVLSDTV